MIEFNFQFPSAWNSEPILHCELFPGNDCASIFDDDPQKSTVRNECSAHSGSGCSSDVGDWTNIQNICDILPDDEESAYLLAEEKNLVDSLNLTDLNWTAFSECFTEQIASQSNILNDNVLKRQAEKLEEALLEHINSTKEWSRMSPEEQLETVEALTQIINHRMNFCEQMKIISVIDPSAVITSSDKEFAIDLEHLNDPKFQTMKHIVKQHLICEANIQVDRLPKSSDLSSGLQNSSHLPAKEELRKKPPCEKETRLKNIKVRQRRLHHEKRRKRHSELFIHERNIRKENSPEQEEDDKPSCEKETKVSIQKLIRQVRKEKRSGLFIHERKIRKQNSPEHEEDDVNILE